MGIPFLHPWANRLSSTDFTLAGRAVHIDTARTRLDGNGLPMHGLLAAAPGWTVEHHDDTHLAAGFDFADPAFPFPHTIRLEAALTPQALTITTTISAGEPVPIAFGFHPYLQLPDLPREEWIAEIPVTEKLLLDDAMIPTGEREPAGDLDGPLGERTFDDGYTVDPAGVTFALSGGGRRLEVAFEQGYGFAQVFAPEVEDVICFEPMTAPADALRHSPKTVPPGESFSARFSVSVA
jgi:galactose mutarotase-like enzyme